MTYILCNYPKTKNKNNNTKQNSFFAHLATCFLVRKIRIFFLTKIFFQHFLFAKSPRSNNRNILAEHVCESLNVLRAENFFFGRIMKNKMSRHRLLEIVNVSKPLSFNCIYKFVIAMITIIVFSPQSKRIVTQLFNLNVSFFRLLFRYERVITFDVALCRSSLLQMLLQTLMKRFFFYSLQKKIQSVKMSTFLLSLLKKQNFQNVAVQKLNSVCLLDHNSSLLDFICS